MPKTTSTLTAQVLALLSTPPMAAEQQDITNAHTLAGDSLKTAERVLQQLGPQQLGLHQLVERQAALTPQNVAVVHQGQTLTYAALNERANQLAHYLISLGIKPEQLIGISLVRSPEMLVAFLGVLKAGAAYVPIDPNYPEARRHYILADAQVTITLTQTDLIPSLEGDGNQLICLDQAEPPLAQQLVQQPKENPAVPIRPEQLAYVIYTSGSTGSPKGVMAHHLGLVNYSLALAEALN